MLLDERYLEEWRAAVDKALEYGEPATRWCVRDSVYDYPEVVTCSQGDTYTSPVAMLVSWPEFAVHIAYSNPQAVKELITDLQRKEEQLTALKEQVGIGED